MQTQHQTQAMPLTTVEPRRRWGGLVRRREVWTLSRRGWIVASLGIFGLFALLLLGVHPFLAVTQRVEPDVLVIEGWIPDYALLAGWDEFRRNHYSTLLTVGGPFRSGVNLDPDDDYADFAAYKLRKMVGKGIPVIPVPCPLEKRDRTYTCALTIKAWLARHDPTARNVTVVTLGPHARRSRLLYQKAFGPGAEVGVIAFQDQDYDARHWWRYSEGVKEVMSEAFAYLYARLIFYPGQ